MKNESDTLNLIRKIQKYRNLSSSQTLSGTTELYIYEVSKVFTFLS